MRVWLDIDDVPLIGIADAETITAIYSKTAREMDLSDLGLSEEDYTKYEKISEEFFTWQDKLHDAFKASVVKR